MKIARKTFVLSLLFTLVLFSSGPLAAEKGAPKEGPKVQEYVIPTPYSFPVDLVADKDGQVWFIAQSTGKLGVIDKSMKFTEHSLPDGSRPSGIAIDPGGVLWITLSSASSNALYSFSPATKKTGTFKLQRPNSEPYKIFCAPDGAVWFTERNANGIGVLRGAKIKEYRVPTPDSQPSGIAVDAGGVVWFTEATGNKLGRLDPATGAISEYRIPRGYSEPAGMAIDKKGMVWLVEMNGNRLVMFDPASSLFSEAIIPTMSSVPAGIAVSGDGSVWFTESKGNKVGSFDPVSARFTEFQIPTNSSMPIGIIVDSSGRVWFTESSRDANKLATIVP